LALFRRSRSGHGEYIDLSIQESAVENIEVVLTEYLHLGKIAKRKNDKHDLVPWELYPCQDGYAAVIGGPVRKWLQAVELFEEPRLLSERYQHMADRMRHREETVSLMQPWLRRHQKKEVYHAGQTRGLAFGYLATFAEVLESPQHRAREYFVEIEHPVVGKHKYCDAPFRPFETPWQSRRAPLLGEHNEEIYGDCLSYSLNEMQRLREEGVI
jgi:crotonobetainyl-CoA:carnitine CoA-transferase CaiB-like acyl-CoA transferase